MQTNKDRELAAESIKIRTEEQDKNLMEEIEQNINEDSSMIHEVYENESQMQDEGEENVKNEQKNEEEEYDDYEYGEYQEYDEEGDYMIDEPLHTFERVQSAEKNTQCSMEHLIKIIEKDFERVMLLTGFDRFWAFILYQTCEWKMTNVENVIDEKLTSHKIVNFKPIYAEILNLKGECDVCCSENHNLIKNLCGHQFCLNCWKDHLKQRMETFYLDPFPTCLDDACKTKTSPFILEIISLNDESFKKLYERTLCRSYAVGNNSVKMCKGREGKSCDQCFKVNKLFERLECENCGNILCAKCGEDYHWPCECYELSNWRNIVENSTNFMAILDYKPCPNCNQAVEKSVGCNSVICKCQTMFCYICGEKWLPNHSKHGFCYRNEEIEALKKERKKKTENNQNYTEKLEKNKEKIETFNFKIKEVQKINAKTLQSEMMYKFKILSNQLDYLEPLLKILKVSLMVAKGYVVSLHFNDSEVFKVKQEILESFVKNAYDFLIYELPIMLEAFSEKETVSKKALELRKNKINPQEQLAKSRILMLESMKNIEKYIHQ